MSPMKHFAILMESNLSQQAHSNVLKLLSRIVFPTVALSFFIAGRNIENNKGRDGSKVPRVL